MDDWTVGEVARQARVSVRTLHHYDQLGLVRPSSRSRAGYRLYAPADRRRLFEVLVLREMRVPLAEIAELIDDEAGDRRRRLSGHRQRMAVERERLDRVLSALDRLLQEEITVDEGLADMPGENPYAEEAEQRWGDTGAHRESTLRKAGYSAEDWQRQAEEREAIEQAYAELLRSGVPATDDVAMEVAERARRHIDTWFYPCPPQMHAGLAAMYVADERFAEHYDRREAGLARYVSDAILANCLRQSGD